MSRYVKDSNGDWHLTAGMNQIDTELSISSTNPVQNKVIKEALNKKLTTGLIDDLSQVPNNDLAFMEDGCYMFRSAIIQHENAKNMPPLQGGVMITVTTIPENQAKIFEAIPFVDSFSSYKGSCFSNTANPVITWTTLMPTMTNPNLIDNPWFTVNQRNKSTYTSPNDYYCADRWRIYNNTSTTLSDNGITFSNNESSDWINLHQLKELGCVELGNVYTMSVRFADGTIEKGTVQIPSSVSDTWAQQVIVRKSTWAIGLYFRTNTIQFYIGVAPGNSVTFKNENAP